MAQWGSFFLYSPSVPQQTLHSSFKAMVQRNLSNKPTVQVACLNAPPVDRRCSSLHNLLNYFFFFFPNGESISIPQYQRCGSYSSQLRHSLFRLCYLHGSLNNAIPTSFLSDALERFLQTHCVINRKIFSIKTANCFDKVQ